MFGALDTEIMKFDLGIPGGYSGGTKGVAAGYYGLTGGLPGTQGGTTGYSGGTPVDPSGDPPGFPPPSGILPGGPKGILMGDPPGLCRHAAAWSESAVFGLFGALETEVMDFTLGTPRGTRGVPRGYSTE